MSGDALWKVVEAKEAARRAKRPASRSKLPLWDRPSMKALLESLPADQRSTLRALVDDYRECCLFLHGRQFYDVKTLVELVKLGWRRT